MSKVKERKDMTAVERKMNLRKKEKKRKNDSEL